jgi:hypothetical protein
LIDAINATIDLSTSAFETDVVAADTEYPVVAVFVTVPDTLTTTLNVPSVVICALRVLTPFVNRSAAVTAFVRVPPPTDTVSIAPIADASLTAPPVESLAVIVITAISPIL